MTTEPAATTEFSPTVTPPMTVAAAAIQTFLSITMGFPMVTARRWTVEELAREAGSSRTVLAERFHAVLGQAPIEYVTCWRMQLAAERIRAGSGSLAGIAADVGYDSEAAFNRAFKRVTGVTPGRWRDGGLITAAAS